MDDALHDRSLVRTIPKLFTWLTKVICWLLNVKAGITLFERNCKLAGLSNIIALVLEAFSDNLCAIAQIVTRNMSAFRCSIAELIVLGVH